MERVDDTKLATARRGALIGWRRVQTEHGIVLRLQIAATADDVRTRRLNTVDIALNDRQLRSLARDLMRAAAERGLDLFARKGRWFGFGRRSPRP